MKKTKIAFFGYGMYGGGAESNAIHIATFLEKRGYCVDVTLIHKIHDYRFQYKKEYKRIRFIHLLKNRRHFNFILKPFLGLLLFLQFLSRVYRDGHKVLISIVEYYPSFVVVIIARLLKRKSIVILGDNNREDLRSKYFIQRGIDFIFLFISIALADKVVCVSEGVKDSMSAMFPRQSSKFIRIYNGVAVRLISQKKGIKKEGVHLLSIGRLVEKKRHELLIRSMQILVKKYPTLSLTIVGKGRTEPALKELVRDLHLDGNVVFTGFIHKNPFRHMTYSHIFVFTSKYEGFGNTIIESLQSGVPVVSMNCNFGPMEILNESNAYDFPQKKHVFQAKYGMLVDQTGSLKTDSQSLSEAIERLIENRKLYTKYKRMSRKRGHFFAKDKMCYHYYKLISSLI